MSQAVFEVSAGQHDREHCPVWVDVSPDLVGDGQLVLKNAAGDAVPCQVLNGDKPAMCFVLDRLSKGQSTTLTLHKGEAPDEGGVQLVDVPGEKVDVKIGGKLFTSYHYADKWARPFLLPIVGPFGDTITRHYPVDEVEGEAQDHHHHKSFWVAWGEVNGTDNWSETEDRYARQVHQTFRAMDSGPVFGRIVALNHWVSHEGDKVLEEERTYVFYSLPAMGRLVDLTVKFMATEGPVEFGDTKEGGIASIRVATSMDAKKDGTIVNGYGGINEAETWGKRAPWCDYFGPVKGNTVGITIFDTPTNFRYPTYWHVRNYGLMTANAFGLSHFYNDPSRNGSHTIDKGAVFPFSYRVYFHAGDTWQARVADRFADYVTPPAVEVQ